MTHKISDDCIMCGTCKEECPVEAISEGDPKYVIDAEKCTDCGTCADVCPVKIEIPKLLLALRAEVNIAKAKTGANWLEHLIFRGWAWLMRHPKLFELGGMMGAAALPAPAEGGLIRKVLPFMRVGPLKAWLQERDLPPLPEKSFRQLWRERVKTEKN